MTSLARTKYAEYIRDITALGNPFLLALVSACILGNLPSALAWKAAGLLAALFLWNELFCSSIKYFWHKPRPDGQRFEGGMQKIDAGSFPSIHAARILLVYGYLSYWAWLGLQVYFFPWTALMVVLAVGYSRVFLRKHFWTDVLAGYAFAALWLGLTYWLAAPEFTS